MTAVPAKKSQSISVQLIRLNQLNESVKKKFLNKLLLFIVKLRDALLFYCKHQILAWKKKKKVTIFALDHFIWALHSISFAHRS